MTIQGDAPAVGKSAFENAADGCTVSVRKDSKGWGFKAWLFGTWNGMAVKQVDAAQP